jgi:hypothetical protein
MATTEKNIAEQIAGLAASVGALSLVVGATLAVINQEIPDFKNRALGTLRKAAVGKPARFATANAQAVAGLAAKMLSDLDDV